MPLSKSPSAQTVGKNIATEEKAGRPKKQAVAIALSTQRKARGDDPQPPFEAQEKPGKARDAMMGGRTGNQPAGGSYSAPQVMGSPMNPRNGEMPGNAPASAGNPRNVPGSGRDARSPVLFGQPHDPRNGQGARDARALNQPKAHNAQGKMYPDARSPAVMGSPKDPKSGSFDMAMAGSARHSSEAWDALEKSMGVARKRDERAIGPSMGQSQRKVMGGQGGQGMP